MMIHKRVMELTKGVRTGIVCKALIGVAISATYIVQAATLGTIVGLLYKRAAFSALFDSNYRYAACINLYKFRVWKKDYRHSKKYTQTAHLCKAAKTGTRIFG